MRISDWSSDVCSSDLTQVDPHLLCHGNQVHAIGGGAAEDPRLQALDELEVLLGLGDAEREECRTDPLDALDRTPPAEEQAEREADLDQVIGSDAPAPPGHRVDVQIGRAAWRGRVWQDG